LNISILNIRILVFVDFHDEWPSHSHGPDETTGLLLRFILGAPVAPNEALPGRL